MSHEVPAAKDVQKLHVVFFHRTSHAWLENRRTDSRVNRRHRTAERLINSRGLCEVGNLRRASDVGCCGKDRVLHCRTGQDIRAQREIRRQFVRTNGLTRLVAVGK